MKFHSIMFVALGALSLLACGSDTGNGGSDDLDGGVEPGEADANPLEPQPECEGEAAVPFMGNQQMIISNLAIGSREDALDLDGDGEPDNKMAALSSVAQEAITDSLNNFDIIIPMEFYDVGNDFADDDCVKFNLYQGDYRLDTDGDGRDTANDGGDCNDNVMAIRPGVAEVADNGVDDDCDGLADENGDTPSSDTTDADQDGQTIADGDCDDTNADIKLGLPEICGDGLDNNCDGVADWVVGAADAYCSPFDDDLDPIKVNANSFDDNGDPLITFNNGRVFTEGGQLRLKAGPSLFQLALPITDGLALDLRITAATITGDLVMTPAGWSLQNAKLGGVIDANTSDKVRGIEVPEIMLREEDSLADAIYVNVLGAIFGLPLAPNGTEGEGCLTPDIDVDGDGLEAFCDSTPDVEPLVVDKCVDGDGTTVILDEGTTQCTEAVDENGNLRFVDGVSIMIAFDTVPATLPSSLE